MTLEKTNSTLSQLQTREESASARLIKAKKQIIDNLIPEEKLIANMIYELAKIKLDQANASNKPISYEQAGKKAMRSIRDIMIAGLSFNSSEKETYDIFNAPIIKLAFEGIEKNHQAFEDMKVNHPDWFDDNGNLKIMNNKTFIIIGLVVVIVVAFLIFGNVSNQNKITNTTDVTINNDIPKTLAPVKEFSMTSFYEMKDGKASCKIHETKPVVCKE